jgi:hypothetical protein
VGLLLRHPDAKDQPFVLGGFNLNNQHTDHDRRLVGDYTKLRDPVIRIIAHTFEHHPNFRDRIVKLWFEEKDCGEIAPMVKHMPLKLAQQTLTHLKSTHPASFFYRKDEQQHDADEDEHTIVSFLGKLPFGLPDELWDALARHDTLRLRSPATQTTHRFLASAVTDAPMTRFGKHVLQG